MENGIRISLVQSYAHAHVRTRAHLFTILKIVQWHILYMPFKLNRHTYTHTHRHHMYSYQINTAHTTVHMFYSVYCHKIRDTSISLSLSSKWQKKPRNVNICICVCVCALDAYTNMIDIKLKHLSCQYVLFSCVSLSFFRSPKFQFYYVILNLFLLFLLSLWL